MVYLDYSKAFDLVFYAVLLQNLHMLGFDTSDRLGAAFLQGRFMSVSVAGNLSDEVAVTSGVPQGSVICPYYF